MIIQYIHSHPPYMNIVLICPQFDDAPRRGGKDPPHTDVTHYSDTSASHATQPGYSQH